MEKVVLFIFLFCNLVFLPNFVLAYSPQTTHAGLTEQAVEFYNFNNNVKINSSDKELIIKGAIDEDNPALRCLNHFYDPLRKIGLNNYQDAQDWITKANNGNDFIWEENIRKYAKGDRDGALIGLGHILHLIEDMTVPDHTRNDPHIADGLSGIYTGASVYEKWAKEYKNRKTMTGTASYYAYLKLRPRKFDDIRDSLQNLASYSNNNYVSPDTIENSVYQYPFPQVIKKADGYAYGVDSFFYDEHKLFISRKGENNKEIKSLVYIDVFNNGDYSVLEDYFSRLGKMAILSGVGVTELFFMEAETARTKYLEVEKAKQEKLAKAEWERSQNLTGGSIYSQIWYRFSYAITDTVSALTNTISNSFASITSTFYNGGSLVLNSFKNVRGSLGFMTNELATIGAQKVEQGVENIQKLVSSTGEKIILYTQGNKPILSNPTVTFAEVLKLIAVLSEPAEANNSSNNQNLISTPKQIRRGGSGGHSQNNPIPEIVLAVSTSTATTTEMIITSTNIATTTEEVATTTSVIATTTEVIIESIATTTSTTTTDVATITATTTDEITTTIATTIATTTATTTDQVEEVEVIDTEAPEFAFTLPDQCLNISPTEACLLLNQTANFVFSPVSDDIAFYTISVLDGITATTSENSFTLEFDDDSIYTVSLSATDTAGNISTITVIDLDIYFVPIRIGEFVWNNINTQDISDENEAEKIEIINDTPYDIDLANWSLSTADGSFNLNLEGQVGPGKYFSLVRQVDDLSGDLADQIYTATLKRGSEFLNLKYFSDTIHSKLLNPPMVFSM